MKIIKEGDKKFVGVYRVPIFIGKCKECNATFEVQKHEISSTGEIYCPYCLKYHNNYEFNYVRTDILRPFDPGTIRRRPYTLEYVTSDKVNTSYVSDDEEEKSLDIEIEEVDSPYPSWIILLRFILLFIIFFVFIWWFFNKIVL